MNITLNAFNIIFLFIVASTCSIVILSTAILHIFSLGKSKNTLKKIRNKYSLPQRIILLHVKENKNCKCHQTALKRLLIIWDIYITIFLLCAVLCVIILILGPKYYEIAFLWCVKVKAYIIDIPIVIYFFIMTKHDKKHGGITWRWEQDN